DQLEQRVHERTAELAQINQQLKSEIAERQQKESHFRNLAENSHDFICIWDIEAHAWTYCNRLRFLGHPSLELLDTATFFQHVHPDAKAHVQAVWLNSEKSGQETQIEYRLRNARGEWEWVHAHESVLAQDEQAQPAQILISLQVITERKQYEETLRL